MVRRSKKEEAKNHEHFCTVMRGLFRVGLQYTSTQPAQDIDRSLVNIVNTTGWINERQLDTKLASKNESLGTSFMRLQPPSGLTKCLVALWAEWNFEDEWARCKFEIGFMRSKDQAFGYRFDSPHPQVKHNYWHVQFMQKFSAAGLPVCKAAYIDVSTPAFPTLVKSPAELGVLAAISVYGMPLTNDLRSYMSRIPLTNEHLRPFVPIVP